MATSTNFPLPTTPLVDEKGNMTWAWLQFFQTIFQATGGSLPASSAVQLQTTGIAGTLQAYSNGQKIGTVVVTP